MLHTSKRLLVAGEGLSISSLRERLFGEGFEVVFCPDGACVQQHIERYGLPHLMIVNLNLPDISGLNLCRQMQIMADLPIIALTVHDQPGLAAQALAYADDYLRLPVDPDELAMRVKRILSRIASFSYASGRRVEVCDNLTIDYVNRHAIVDGEVRQLTPTENMLLSVLVKHTGRVVDADTLIERTWRSGIGVSDRNALRVHMHRLRNKIERDPASPSVILTERGVGYIFPGC